MAIPKIILTFVTSNKTNTTMDIKEIFEGELKKSRNVRNENERIKEEKFKENYKLMSALMNKLEFFNKYGFGFYLSFERNDGWHDSQTPDYHYYIRSKSHIGYICHCVFNGDEVDTVRTTFPTALQPYNVKFEEFVKRLAKMVA